MISFKQAIGWVQPRGQQDIKLWDDTISAVNKSPIIGKADLGFISSITSINKLERIWFYEYFKKEPSEDMKKWLVIFSTSISSIKLEVSCFSSTGSRKFRNRRSEIFQIEKESNSNWLSQEILFGFDVRIFRFSKKWLTPGSRSETEVENMTLYRNLWVSFS